MIGLIGLLAGDILYEAVKFAVMLLLLVGGVLIGGKLRVRSDARKAAKKAAEQNGKPAEESSIID